MSVQFSDAMSGSIQRVPSRIAQSSAVHLHMIVHVETMSEPLRLLRIGVENVYL